mmetsp:Transcript_20738/g.62513  ORF Transcript_20738/g.62513 Transcript_20738/m.62513 type:complete len:82 (-) Transcript_20738:142-387(-)
MEQPACVTVAVRCRPLAPRESNAGCMPIVSVDQKRVAVGDPVELAERGASPIWGRSFGRAARVRTSSKLSDAGDRDAAPLT